MNQISNAKDWRICRDPLITFCADPVVRLFAYRFHAEPEATFKDHSGELPVRIRAVSERIATDAELPKREKQGELL